MKHFPLLGVLALFLGAATALTAQGMREHTVIVTASNTTANNLLVYSTSGHLLQTVSTNGKGGVSGNAGGIAHFHDWLAAVNFGSQNVSLFKRTDAGFVLKQVVPALGGPLSVAFGHGHLYILTGTKVESHQLWDFGASPSPDGSAGLVVADGSAAQVGALETQLVISEKSNMIETVNLAWDGAVTGSASMVANIPSNVNAPFGLATRGDDAYVTIAHANEISLVRDNAIVTITGSGTQMAPCWLTLDGPFLFSANSPSMSVSRYLVYSDKIVQQAAVVASFNGDPTDIDYRDGVAAVIDSNGSASHISAFKVDGDGNFALLGSATVASAINGAAVMADGD
jgi:hypothetical protein